PDADTLRARRAVYPGLTRPELAVLMAYAKIHLQHALLASPLPDDPLVEPHLVGYFPGAVAERFPDAVRAHPLRREVVATALANTDPARPAAELAAELGDATARVRGRLPEWIAGAEAEAFARLRSELEIAGLPVALAHDLATADWLVGALDVITVARAAGVDP